MSQFGLERCLLHPGHQHPASLAERKKKAGPSCSTAVQHMHTKLLVRVPRCLVGNIVSLLVARLRFEISLGVGEINVSKR